MFLGGGVEIFTSGAKKYLPPSPKKFCPWGITERGRAEYLVITKEGL